MSNALILELVRQAMRWIGLFLIAKGLPPDLVKFLGDPTFVNGVAGVIVYACAETGWLTKLVNRFRAWRKERSLA